MEGNERGSSDDVVRDGPPATTRMSQARMSQARLSTMTRWSIALLIAGVLAMILPGLLRDGLCGLVECADVTPEVAVGRPGGTGLAVVVPPKAAGELQSLRLFQIDDDSAQGTGGSWVVYRQDAEVAPERIPLGSEPEGFATRSELESQPTEGVWVLDASFGCASTLVRFSPQELDPGFVTAGGRPATIGDFEDGALTNLRCSTDAPAWQLWLFMLGALAAGVGAVLGIWVVVRGPVKEDPDWYAPEDDLA